jgi:anaerobic selenocysteine-containing dehydrogenase
MTLVKRRDVLLGLGGGIAGAFLTPLPWALLDDVSIWTQHRRALPIPPDGETTFGTAACTLCPASCALRVRSVAGRPVFAAGESRHPLGGGACAFGLALHHLAHHPLRLSHPVRIAGDGRPTGIAGEAAVSAMADAIRASARSGRAVVVLDQRPGRVLSRAYRELMAGIPGGLYATAGGEDATLTMLASAPGRRPGIDLERTRTLLSFGAPVLEGWGRPGRMLAARAGLRVVQADAWRSPTACLADEWIAIRPGGEGPLALALAHVLVNEGLVARPTGDVLHVLSRFAPADVAHVAGLAPAAIEALARSLVAQGPTVAIGGGDPGGGPLREDDERAIALLDVVLGSVGRAGGIVWRRDVPDEGDPQLPPEQRLEDVPDGRAGLLILDGADSGRALPWPAVRRKLAPGALVVSLSPFLSGLARHASLVVPGPAPLEGHDEVLPTADAAVASYAVSKPLLSERPHVVDPMLLLVRLARAARLDPPSAASHEEALRHRAAAIHALRRGRVLVRRDDGFHEDSPASDEAFWEEVSNGGCWIDDPLPAAVPFAGAVRLPSVASVERWLAPLAPRADLPLVAFAARGAAGSIPPSPILSKLYQEAELRPSVSTVALHPDTARSLGLVEGRRIRVHSSTGAVDARLRCEDGVPHGVVALAAGPESSALHGRPAAAAEGALALAVVAADLTWRGTRVAIEGTATRLTERIGEGAAPSDRSAQEA